MFKKDVIIALTIFMVLMISLIFLFDFRPPGLVVILIYIVIYGVVSAIMSRMSRRVDNEESELEEELPTSGPIGRFGQTGLIMIFTITSLLSLFNPFQLTQIILQAIGNVYLQTQAKTLESREQIPPNQIEYTLPFTGEWFVYNGGVTEKKSHSWDVLTLRYAYDFVQVNDQLKRHSGTGTQLTDYYCFGQNILAAADGTVVKVVDRVRSAPLVGYGIVDFLATNFVGNYVIIQHAENEYGLYAHLIKGSVPVKVGDTVSQGQVIGQCGHSGHSSEPHLHFHLQDRPNFYFALGVPIQFSNVMVDCEMKENAFIQAGNRVQAVSQPQKEPI